MSRQLILISILIFSPFTFAKNKGIFSTEIVPSTTKHSDPNEIVTFVGKFNSEVDFDFVNVEWKFEGDIEIVSGQTKTTVNNVKANQTESEEIHVRIKNPAGAKIVFWVYKDVDGARVGSTQIYVPATSSFETQSLNTGKAKAFRIKSKKIFH